MTTRGTVDAPVRALLLCQNLGIAGGVERFACALANHLAGQGVDAALGSVDTQRAAVPYELDARVRVLAARSPVDLSEPATGGRLGRLWKLLQNQWRTGSALAALIRRERPDVIVLNGLTTACSVLLMNLGCASRVICCDHNHFDARSRPWRVLRSWLYPKVAAVVSLTQADASKFSALNPRTETIYNASTLQADSPAVPIEPMTVLAIGRCVAQKGFDLLLQAWSIVAERVPSARLRIVGDGPLLRELQAQTRRAGLDDCIDWTAPTAHIEQHYREAAVFVLPSRYEGMPLVLLEAQAMGLPAVAFDCPTGPREIVSDDTGIVVPPLDVNALARALVAMLSEPARRSRMAVAAIRRSREMFSPQAHFERWTALVIDVAAQASARHA